MKKLLLFLIALFICLQYSLAQTMSPTVINCMGGSDNNSTWSLGELIVETYSINDLTVTQGFLQTELLTEEETEDDSEEESAINELKEVGIQMRIFPNPARDNLNLKIAGLGKNFMTIKLLGLNGKLLKIKKVRQDQSLVELEIEDLSSGVYILKATYNRRSNIYKIIKQ